MQRINSLLVISAMTMVVLSCRREYKLGVGDLDYIPYKGHEILIFESDQGRMDTIFLKGLEDFTGCMDPLAIFPDKCEGKYLVCTKTDPNYDRYLEGKSLVEIEAVPKDETRISFDITLKGSWFYGLDSYSLSEFDSIPEELLIIGEKTYSDVKVFKASEYAKQYKRRDNFAERFYWSLKEGFLGLDRRDEKWRLVKKMDS